MDKESGGVIEEEEKENGGEMERGREGARGRGREREGTGGEDEDTLGVNFEMPVLSLLLFFSSTPLFPFFPTCLCLREEERE